MRDIIKSTNLDPYARRDRRFIAIAVFVVAISQIVLASYIYELRNDVYELKQTTGLVADDNNLLDRIQQLEQNQGHLLRTNDNEVEK